MMEHQQDDEEDGTDGVHDLASWLVLVRHRWAALASFAFAGFVNGLFWITFSPIRNLSVGFFGLSNGDDGDAPGGGERKMDAMSVSYLVLYIPGSVLGLWMLSRFDLRTGLVFCTFVTFVGGAFRYLAALLASRESSDADLNYALLLFGQSLAGLVQPFVTNTPAKVAVRWFPQERLDVATAIASLTNPLGIIFGTILSSTTVKKTESGPVEGMETLLMIQVLISLVSLGLILVAFPNRPEVLPSEAVRAQMSLMENREHFNGGFTKVASRVWSHVRTCLRNVQYLYVLLAFCIGISAFNALSTLIEDFLQPLCSPNKEDDASIVTSALLISGLVATAGTSSYLDRTKNYARVLRLGSFLAFVSMVGIMMSLWQVRPRAELIAWFALLGVAIVPLLPTAMQGVAELTYPVPEDVSSMLLQSVGQTIGVALIAMESALLDHDEKRDCTDDTQGRIPQIQPSAIAFMTWSLISLIAVWRLDIRPHRADVILAERIPSMEQNSLNTRTSLLGHQDRD